MTASAFSAPERPVPPAPARESPGEAGIARTGHSAPRPDLLTLVLDTIQSPETRRHYGRSMLEFASTPGCRAAKNLGKGGAAMLHELMRHASMQVTMDYYANVDDALQDAIVRII